MTIQVVLRKQQYCFLAVICIVVVSLRKEEITSMQQQCHLEVYQAGRTIPFTTDVWYEERKKQRAFFADEGQFELFVTVPRTNYIINVKAAVNGFCPVNGLLQDHSTGFYILHPGMTELHLDSWHLREGGSVPFQFYRGPRGIHIPEQRIVVTLSFFERSLKPSKRHQPISFLYSYDRVLGYSSYALS